MGVKYSPFSSGFVRPPNPGEPEIGSRPVTRNLEAVAMPPRRFPVAEGIAALREKSEADDLDLEAFLDQVVERAQTLTGASGAAIAVRQGQIILCRARCGEMAPPRGTQLEADSGISAECLRTGKVLRCEDSEQDIRVDPQVCRRLGLRSIAVVPVFGRTRVAGILEAFSPYPHAFDDQDLQTLELLGALVTTARQRSSEAKSHGLTCTGSAALPTEVEGRVSAYTPARGRCHIVGEEWPGAPHLSARKDFSPPAPPAAQRTFPACGQYVRNPVHRFHKTTYLGASCMRLASLVHMLALLKLPIGSGYFTSMV